MKFIIQDEDGKRYEFSEEKFRKRLDSFLILYEYRKTLKQKEDLLQRLALAIKSNAIFLYESCGFKFVAMPERRTL